MIDLSVDIAGVHLNNPVMPASGTYEFTLVRELIGLAHVTSPGS